MEWNATDMCSSTPGDRLIARSSSTATTSPRLPTMPSFSFWGGLARGVGLALGVGVGVGPQRSGASAVDRDGRGQLLAPHHIHAKSPINGTRSACEWQL